MAHGDAGMDGVFWASAVRSSQRDHRAIGVDGLRGRVPECLRASRLARRPSGIADAPVRRSDRSAGHWTGAATIAEIYCGRQSLTYVRPHFQAHRGLLVQDTRTARARQSRTRELFREYQSAVSHIVMLRAFREGQDRVPRLYQLVEIPASIFDSIQSAPLSVFERDAPLIECEVDGEAAAVVAIDRSDAKITIRRIQLAACTVHAEWSRA